MYFSRILLGGRQVHTIRNGAYVKRRRRRRAERAQAVEDFLRPYHLKKWGSTQWFAKLEASDQLARLNLALARHTSSHVDAPKLSEE